LNDRSRTLLVPVVHRQLTMVLAMEVPSTGGASQGVVGTEMSCALVYRSVAAGGAASAPRSSGIMSPELPRPYLPALPTLCSHLSIGGGSRVK
jgi:hypothetical protein